MKIAFISATVPAEREGAHVVANDVAHFRVAQRPHQLIEDAFVRRAERSVRLHRADFLIPGLNAGVIGRRARQAHKAERVDDNVSGLLWLIVRAGSEDWNFVHRRGLLKQRPTRRLQRRRRRLVDRAPREVIEQTPDVVDFEPREIRSRKPLLIDDAARGTGQDERDGLGTTAPARCSVPVQVASWVARRRMKA